MGYHYDRVFLFNGGKETFIIRDKAIVRSFFRRITLWGEIKYPLVTDGQRTVTREFANRAVDHSFLVNLNSNGFISCDYKHNSAFYYKYDKKENGSGSSSLFSDILHNQFYRHYEGHGWMVDGVSFAIKFILDYNHIFWATISADYDYINAPPYHYFLNTSHFCSSTQQYPKNRAAFDGHELDVWFEVNNALYFPGIGHINRTCMIIGKDE